MINWQNIGRFLVLKWKKHVVRYVPFTKQVSGDLNERHPFSTFRNIIRNIYRINFWLQTSFIDLKNHSQNNDNGRPILLV